MTMEYNTVGNVTKEVYYDTEGNPTNTTMGFASVEYTYDDLGNLTSEHFYDTQAMGVVPEDALYAYVLMEYDDTGRLTSEQYFDENDNPVVNREGFSNHLISYTDSGLISEETYQDNYGRPIAVEGIDNRNVVVSENNTIGAEALITPFRYSRRTLLSENPEDETYVMSVVDETADEDSAYATVIQTYDRYDRATESIYLDANGAPAIGPEGCNMVRREFTSRDQISLVRYFDKDGNGTAVNGVYGVSREYNSYANLEVETWLDADGNPSRNTDGYASIRYDYDLSDQKSVEKYFQYYEDEAGVPAAAANGAWGITMLYYPVTRVHVVTYIDQQGNPVETTDMYAILEYETDEHENRVWEGYYDTAHVQTNCSAGYASVERGFDNQGRMISERYLDRYNKLTNNAEGIASWNGYYNEEGNLVITNRYDKDLQTVTIEE